jgi:glyoxylase-like metal-dependent hydrolase (beta-lactamase superfamily II)
MKLFIQVFTFNGFQENTYIVYSESGDAVIIDPGCYDAQEEKDLLSFIINKNLKVKALLNTHAHIDHVLGNAFVLRNFEVDYYLHKDDLFVLKSVSDYAHLYGFKGYQVSPEPSKILNGGEKLVFGDIEFDVLFTPGHAPGHVVFHNPENKFVINGDVLFKGSFGRIDLPGGDMATLKKSINVVMFVLPEETVVYCGHGPKTSIGEEIRTNYINQF